jgi:SAM-dependent methyltransferase
MPWWAWLAAALALAALLAALLVWLLGVTEGAYLGPGVVTALYDRFAGRYDRIKQFDDADEAFFLGEPVERYLAGLGLDPGDAAWALDVAAGTGRLPATVLRAWQGRCRFILLDRSEGMLRRAQVKLAEAPSTGLLFLKYDAAPLPFAGGQFDVVSCLEALEFMPDPKAVLVELLRVARPGGLVLVTRRIGRDARLMPGKVFGREELAELLRTAGAGAVDIRPWQVDYELAWALKADMVSAGPRCVEWADLVRCPFHGEYPVVHRPFGELDELCCTQCEWRLRMEAGLWQPVHSS